MGTILRMKTTFRAIPSASCHYDLLLELGLRLVLIVMPQRNLIGRNQDLIGYFPDVLIGTCRRYSIHPPVLHDVAELAYVVGVSITARIGQLVSWSVKNTLPPKKGKIKLLSIYNILIIYR